MSHIVVLSTALNSDVGAHGRYPLAGLKGGIPVLWNLFFEAPDLSRQLRTISREKTDVVVTATRKASALERLELRLSWYCELLGFCALAEYAALLAASVRATAGEYLMMDLSHIAAQRGPGEFYEEYRRLLTDIADAFDRALVAPALRQRLLVTSGYDPSRPFPPARLLLDAEHPHWEAAQDHARIIGASWTGSLAWERGSSGEPR